FIHSILDCVQDRVKCFTYVHKHIVILAVCCLCVYGVCCFGSEQGRWLVRQNDKIERLKALKTDLKSTERVVVDLGPYGHTMLAFNVLSRDHLLFPTSLTYMAPAILTEAELLPGRASWLTFSDCKAVMERTPYELPRTSKGSLDAHYVVMQPDKTVGAFRFWLEDGGCMLCRELKTSGLADPDTWGRWSADRSVTMVYEIPPVLRGSALRFSFKVLPYVSSRIDFQNVFVAIQDMHYSNIELRHLDFVKIDVPAQQTFDSHIVFRFDLPDASVAENDGALSCDGRLLAVKFIDLAVERI
ncbi:MAG TPA: hypothetical protein DEO88_11445, partial [Syntrophobacteraceae bacterium]|nr:hypothetical protein [Syntrophobacteraceae bacterium]